MPCRISDEISLRHLPNDLSDESVSFQIPSQADSSNLLDDITDCFFGATNDSISTPFPHRNFTLNPAPTPRPDTLSANSPEHNPKNSPMTQTIVNIATSSTNIMQVPPALASESVVDPTNEIPDLIPRDSSGIAKSQNTEKLAITRTSTLPRTFLPAPGKFESLVKDIPSANTNRRPNLAAGASSTESTDLPPRRHRVASSLKAKSKPTVTAGGIIKRSQQTGSQRSDAFATCVPEQHIPESSAGKSQSKIERVSEATNNRLNTSIASSGGVAQKLLMIGQQFINSVIRPSDSEEENCIPPEDQVGANNQAQIVESLSARNDDDPFTQSQLSPRKPEERSRSIEPIVVPVPISPMRPSKKRGSATSEAIDDVVRHVSKKGKIIDPDPGTGIDESKTLQPSRRKNGVPSTSSQLLNERLKAKAKARPPRQLPVTKKDKNRVTARLPAPHASRKPSGSQESGEVDKHRSDIGHKFYNSHPIPSRRPGHMPSVDKTNTLPKPTMPIGFRFELDARMEARNTELDEKTKSLQRRAKVHQGSTVIPDFRASHAALSASLAARMEQKTPIIPEGFSFSTEVRAREREKFDEQVRAKQQEMERQSEERRKQRELEEEQEIKEMRKRTVPKAHQVPEWYASMPKRAGLGESA